jgi:hypothetical protein
VKVFHCSKKKDFYSPIKNGKDKRIFFKKTILS